MKYISLFFVFFMFTNSVSSQSDQSSLIVTTSILPKDYIKSSQNLFFTIQLGAYRKKDVLLASLDNVVIYKENGINKFRIGEFPSYAMAKEYKEMLQGSCKDAFIVSMKNGKRIHIIQALKEKGVVF